ncbi:hypothetical protein FGO68_gene4478 [Halteria grandinella]|uniref:Uncharacterized protein n=1 Tax=Halteria grandinella TaxID=5974 RepID=A0A8J8NE70_HALGN|nr:hypothetical protein FGO68_gene4478 [Halteria grandinella]
MSTSQFCDCSSFRFRAITAALIISCTPFQSSVQSTSQIHFLSRWFQSFSSGKQRVSNGLVRACARKSSTVRPSICGTAATLTPERFMYCIQCKHRQLTSFFALVIYLRKYILTVSILGRYASHSQVRKVNTSFLDCIFSMSCRTLTYSTLACAGFYCIYIYLGGT